MYRRNASRGMDCRSSGRGCGRGGHSFRGTAGFNGKSAVVSSSKNIQEDNSSSGAPAAKMTTADGDNSAPWSHKRFVATVVTENGTEIPKKLNNRVFIDGLPYDSKKTASGSPSLEEELMQFVTAWKVGKPIRLIKKNGQGFGFLTFHSPHSVDVAVRVLNGRKFLGRKLRVEVPKLRDTEGGAGNTKHDTGKSSYTRQVLISDLAKISQPDIIREILRDVAPQLEKRLETIKMTSKNRKAFLTFMSADDVGLAVKFLDGFVMLGRRISAAQAAEPGSLPYSRAAVGSAACTPNALASFTGGSGVAVDRNKLAGAFVSGGSVVKDNDNDGDGAHVVVPLGMLATQSTQQVAKHGEQKARKTSNVTGVTEKYNLLDSGPVEVFVGNVGDEITEEQLRNHFSICGRIVSCEIIVNKNTSLPTGIARVVFALPAYADYAQKHLHGSRLHGHVLRVDRGDEASAPLASGLAPPGSDEVVDEDGYMEHYGVRDRAAYFKGTSFEGEEKGRGGGRRARGPAGGHDDRGKAKKKKRTEGGGGRGAVGHAHQGDVGGGDDDDDGDEEERFRDVDVVDVPLAVSAKRCNTKKRTTKAKKFSR